LSDAAETTAELTAVPADPGSRRTSSARAVLQALSLLARSPDGLRADETAAALGRSVSTAYSLLDSLCQEGFAVHEERGAYRLAPAGALALAPREPAQGDGRAAALTAVLDELYLRTNKRAYLAAARRGTLVIPAMRGRQGMRRMRGLGRSIGDDAHALALGKVALSMMPRPTLERYLEGGLRQFTEHTITCPDALGAQLEQVRLRGVASDEEEYEADFCCIAAPLRDDAGRAVAIVGISMSQRSFAQERAELEATVVEIAGRARLQHARPAAAALPENGAGS
jgi:IclR family acetate operon transcriptional repressor